MNTFVRQTGIEELNKEVDQLAEIRQVSQPPCIGISMNRRDDQSCLAEPYIESVLRAGGVPLLIPVITNMTALREIVKKLDGLVLTGGGDINPLYFGEEPIPQLQDCDSVRDRSDLILLRLAAGYQIPILGICRGHQLINAAFGGSLYQDIAAQYEAPVLKHSQALPREQASHTVRFITEEGQIRKLYPDQTELAVNSIHHQAVKQVAPEFIAVATASDGINEAMEHQDKNIISVQWHPEAMTAAGDVQMKKLFELHVRHAALFKQAKEIHAHILTLDSHVDTPMVYSGMFDFGKRVGGTFNPPHFEGKVNLPLMEEGRLDAVCMVAYIPQGERTTAGYQTAFDYANDRLAQAVLQETLYPSWVGIARSAEDFYRLKKEGKKAIALGVENGYAIGKEITKLEHLRNLGVLYITLCHNGNNDICDSASDQPEWNGLSPFGKEVVREMNRLGLMIDLSHAAESTFYDVLKISSKPVVATHSCARALCDHTRNLTDDQLIALADNGGVIQVGLYPGFIRKGADSATLNEAIQHINHIVDLIGIDHVGIGSDFDGGGELIGCKAANEMVNITVKLLEQGYNETDIAKIWGGNFLRVLCEVRE